MERVSVLQFVLIASIAVSCHSYSVASKKSSHLEAEPPVELQDLESADDTYPEKYIEKLIAALSPEEQKNLTIISEIDVSDRDGNVSSSGCSFHDDVAVPKQLQATDELRTEYYVINTDSVKQLFAIQVCNSNNQTCTNAKLKPDDVGCCVHTEEPKIMSVLSVPVEQFEKRKRKENKEDRIIKIPMLLKTKCSCIGHSPDTSELSHGKNCNSRLELNK